MEVSKNITTKVTSRILRRFDGKYSSGHECRKYYIGEDNNKWFHGGATFSVKLSLKKKTKGTNGLSWSCCF